MPILSLSPQSSKMSFKPQENPLTTHVLNTSDGVPGARMALSLHRLDSKLVIWNLVTVGYSEELSDIDIPLSQSQSVWLNITVGFRLSRLGRFVQLLLFAVVN
uniref:5-hydroxyisourate hydrolase n=1 Tax=Esox lucius TaxID=8010 RepID=C1BWC7_ESOLU|nr:5-hydroxyisourate hydrolase [Esox lucius]